MIKLLHSRRIEVEKEPTGLDKIFVKYKSDKRLPSTVDKEFKKLNSNNSCFKKGAGT